ncbi:MAG TPA: heme lyase CcmF/NrfE family subunit [Alphaproteobacteria bacterium]|nr:heme lyase CcmF/NrfE family subunit [Alphaproteobacteria bacterium]
MIPEIGHFALILALGVALAQSILPLYGAARRDPALMAVAPSAAFAQCALLALSFGALMYCHVTDDFSVLNVVANSHTTKPLLYKITGVWGNHEGSMLLWVFILGVYGLSVSLFGRNLPPALRARALAVQGMVAAGFITYILFTSNPFWRVFPPPANGQGLNPILQDPGLAFHPPCLYMGYVGFSMAFSFAIAALIEGRVDAAWARWVRPWTLAAWCFLTLGIAMGSWWSYYTLGWGGWWYWDPVENASFMPWLAGTALLHSSIVVEKRDTLKAWTILLTIVTFSLSLLGTFLVRSGVLTSVHSFASDPTRGVYILMLLVIVIGSSFVLFAVRAPSLKSGGLFAPISREGGLLLNNMLLSAAAGTVFLGTLYPLFIDALNLGKISVGPPFFNLTFIPIMVPLIVLMALGPFMTWKRGDLRGALSRLKFALAIALVTAVATWFIAGGAASPLWAAGAFGVAAWLLIGTLTEFADRILLLRVPLKESMRRARLLPRAAYGMTIAHAGMAIIIIGIAGSLAWKTEKIQVMRPGDTVAVGGYDVTLKDVKDGVRGPNYTALRATFIATRRGTYVATLRPEKRLYDMPPLPTTDAAIHTDFIGDIYAVIGPPANGQNGKDGYVTRLYYNPLVPWIFTGAVIMVLGGFVSLTDRRYRIGAPKRREARI